MADWLRRILGAKSSVFSIICPVSAAARNTNDSPSYCVTICQELCAKDRCVSRADFFQQIGGVEFDGTRTNAERARAISLLENP
jgi:hypothetical protein